MVQLREAAVAPSSLHGVSGLVPPDQEPVAEDWCGLQVGAPTSAGFEMAMEGGGHRSGSGVSGGGQRRGLKQKSQKRKQLLSNTLIFDFPVGFSLSIIPVCQPLLG